MDNEPTLAENGMTQTEIHQIEEAIQLARQLEAEATLRGQQRLIERQAKAKTTKDKGKAKIENPTPIDKRVFHTDNWEYSVETQTLYDKLTYQFYPVPWGELQGLVSAATTFVEFKQILADCLNRILVNERMKIGFDFPSEGPILHVKTDASRSPNLEEMETPAKSRMDPPMTVSPDYHVGASIPGSSSTPLEATERPIPMSYAPYEATVLHPPPTSATPSTNVLPTVSNGTMPPIGPTYTSAPSPPTTLGSDPRPPLYAPYVPRPTTRPSPMPPTTTPPYRTPPGFPPRVPTPAIRVGPPLPTFPYYPPPPAAAPDPITLAAAVGRAMAEQLLPRARDGNRTDSRRSVDIAKLMSKFSGDGDPRQHLEIFEQVCDALSERNDVAKSHAFSLTLDDKAGKWYRTLKPEEKRNMATVKAAFIGAFAKQGPKWGLASQLHSAERMQNESMRDFINRLKHLNSRCKPHERFRDDQLLDRLINGMNHTELYNSLITRGITTWDDTVTTVIELEDNLDMKEGTNGPSESTSIKSSPVTSSCIEQMVAACLQKFIQTNNPPPQKEPTRCGAE